MVLILLSKDGIGQHFSMTNFTKESGLPSNQVYDVFQDCNGYIWFATDRGICRYNGYNFQIFTVEDGILDNIVFAFYPQRDGTVWCSSYNNQLFYFKPTDYKFKPYPYNDKIAKLAGNTVISNILVEDSYVYIAYKNEMGYFEVDGAGNIKTKILKQSYYSGEDNLNDRLKYAVYREVNNQGFSCVVDSLGLEDLKASGTDFSALPIKKGAYNVVINRITNNHIAIAGTDFVKILDENRPVKTIDRDLRPLNVERINDTIFYIAYHGGGFELYNDHFQKVDSFLSTKSGTCLLKDRESGIWFSTLYSGVYYLKPTSVKKAFIESDAKISGIAIDSLGNLWLSELKEMANLYQFKNDAFHKWKSFSTREIYPVSYYENYLGMNWFSTEAVNMGSDSIAVTLRNGLRFDVSKKEFIKHKKNKNNVQNPLHGQRVNDVEKKGGGYIVAGSNRVYYFCSSDTVPPQLYQKINDIELYNELEIYSSSNAGVLVKNGSDIFSIAKKEGLSSNYINRTYSDGDSVLWVLSSNGIDKIVGLESSFKVQKSLELDGYDALDMERLDNVIWFTTMTGVYFFDVSLFSPSIHEGLNLHWTSVLVNSKRTEQIANLDFDQNNISFQFLAISYKYHSSLNYRYKLLPNQTEWNMTNDLSLSFLELPPGNYELVLQASVDDIHWEQITKKFEVNPPYYQTWWFRLSIIVLMVLLLYWFFKIRILSYNKDVVREFFRLLIKRLKKNEKILIIRENGFDKKINTQDILFAKAADNYVEIHTIQKIYLARMKIGDFIKIVPDPIEYIRIHRSYVVRIDQIESKSKDLILVNGNELKVSKKYIEELSKVQF